MVSFNCLSFFAICHLILAGNAHITLQDIDALTSTTKDCNERVRAPRLANLETTVKEALLGINSLEDEVEDVVAGALTYLDRDLLSMLNVPVKDIVTLEPDCPAVIESYHAFLAATTRFLQAIDEKQQVFRWDSESTVFNALVWAQALWASRTANEQHLSFIEQQLHLYKAIGCFEKINDVLRRDVEVVEYMNDLIDSFR